MESHPIPQQISSYQFRLVGDMTLKQFFQLGGGALVSLLIYSTGLHPLVKWPLIILSFALGAALAFLPFEDRPLSKWIFSFFRSIYSPTEFAWERSIKTPVFFQEEAIVPQDKIVTPQGEAALEKYLKTPTKDKEIEKNLDKQEETFLAQISHLFGFDHKTPVVSPLPVQKPTNQNQQSKEPTPVPSSSPTVVSKSFRPKIVIEEKAAQNQTDTSNIEATKVAPTLAGADITSQSAQFSPDAAPPMPPSIPNTVVGQVIDPDGKIVEGAILEIRDLAGRPVRALRSNKVGHFIIVTALANGRYEIVTEKDGLVFDPVTFEAKGETVPPVAIKAKERTEIQVLSYTGKPLIIN